LEIDDATNVKELERKAKALEDDFVSKRNFATGKIEAIPGGLKNKDALHR
jgi:hypothetical protein